jgi:hypothetical protein
MITNDARCTCEIKSSIAMAQAACHRKKALFASKFDLTPKEGTNKVINLKHSFVLC